MFSLSLFAISAYYSSPIGATIPSWTPFGTNYRLRVRNSNTSIKSSPNNANLSVNTCGIIGIDKLETDKELSIYPNPNQGSFYLEFKRNINGKVLIEVENIFGQTILYSENKDLLNGDIVNIVTPETVKGVCFVKIRFGEDVIVRRIAVN